VLDTDQPSIVVAAEPAATGTALDLVPAWPFEVEYVTHSLVNPMDSGHRQTMPRHVSQADDSLIERRRFKWKKVGATLAEYGVMAAHWNSHPPGTAFSITPPGMSTLVVHYVSELRRSLVAPGTYNLEAELEEVLS
jgi:hypothetical protein